MSTKVAPLGGMMGDCLPDPRIGAAGTSELDEAAPVLTPVGPAGGPDGPGPLGTEMGTPPGGGPDAVDGKAL